MVIASSESKEYLGTYIAACRSGMKFSVDPQIAEEFKAKIIPTLDNDIRAPDKRDKNMPPLFNLLLDAGKRGVAIVAIANCLKLPIKINYPMDMSYSRDLRLRVIGYIEEGHTLRRPRRCSKYMFVQSLTEESVTKRPAT